MCINFILKLSFISCSPEPRVETQMEKKGREMLQRFGGVPLAIVVLGGLLANRHALSEWERMHNKLDAHCFCFCLIVLGIFFLTSWCWKLNNSEFLTLKRTFDRNIFDFIWVRRLNRSHVTILSLLVQYTSITNE